MTMTRGTAALQLAAAALAAPFLGVAPASAQDGLREEQPPSVGMVLFDDGGWRYPTVEEAFGFLAMDYDEIKRLSAGTPAWHTAGGHSWPMAVILRQVGKERPAAALDAIAGRLTSIILNEDNMEDPESAGSNAAFALMQAARSVKDGKAGVPYRKAFDILVRLYENGYYVHLGSIFRTGGERGRAYVRRLFETSEPPALCTMNGGWAGRSMTDTLPSCKRGQKDVPWCEAGRLLYRDIWRAAYKRTWPTGIMTSDAGRQHPMPKGLPEHVADWHRRCMRT